MSRLLDSIRQAVNEGRVRISDHALDRMIEQGIDIEVTVAGLSRAELLEDYALSRREPRVLLAQRDPVGRVFQVVWEAPQNQQSDAVLVTAFRRYN